VRRFHQVLRGGALENVPYRPSFNKSPLSYTVRPLHVSVRPPMTRHVDHPWVCTSTPPQHALCTHRKARNTV
jgi:hypothetical protein